MNKMALLSIGNSVFINEKEFPALPFALKDATDIYECLCSMNGALFNKNISTLALNKTYDEIRRIIDEFFSRLDRNDFALIYIASHGKVISGGEHSIALKDTSDNGRLVSNSSINLTTLINNLLERKIERYVIINDTCRAGKALQNPFVISRSSNQSFFDEHIGYGKIIIATSQSYQKSYELNSLENGLFVYYFKKAVNEGIPNETKQYLGIRETYDYVYREISKNHIELDQRPEFSGQSIEGKLIICPNRGVDSAEFPKVNKPECTLIIKREKVSFALIFSGFIPMPFFKENDVEIEIFVDGIREAGILGGESKKIFLKEGFHVVKFSYKGYLPSGPHSAGDGHHYINEISTEVHLSKAKVCYIRFKLKQLINLSFGHEKKPKILDSYYV